MVVPWVIISAAPGCVYIPHGQGGGKKTKNNGPVCQVRAYLFVTCIVSQVIFTFKCLWRDFGNIVRQEMYNMHNTRTTTLR